MFPSPLGARSRLLPASVPFRYFGAAVVFHALAWLGLLVAAPDLTAFGGGLGPIFASLHLVTLGVLAMTAVGASMQLLPVATRQAVRSVAAVKLAWWLFVPGVALFALGAALYQPRWMAPGAMAVLVALAIYAWLLGENLLRARGMPLVRAYAWAAFACLLVLLASALALVAYYEHGIALDRRAVLGTHFIAATYGFMGLFALGLSYFLLPMFAVAPAPSARRGYVPLVGALAALTLAFGTLASGGSGAWLAAAAALGLGAALAHIFAMERSLRARLRGPLGPAFLLVRVSWGCLAASLLLAIPLALDRVPAQAVVAFGELLVLGWLLTFLLAVLQRIVPFLASVHASGRGPGAPLASAFSAAGPLAVHRTLHLVAIGALIPGTLLGMSWLVRLGAAAGLAGALAYAVFFTSAMLRLRDAAPPAGAAPTRA